MAKIEMDLSEYEKMQENKKLLEQSLEKERELQSKIEKLSKDNAEQLVLINEEKIKALEDAKMKVVKIRKIENRDYIRLKRSPLDMLERLRTFFYNERFTNGPSTHNVVEQLIDSCFEITQTISGPDVEDITIHGLDEVKQELRAELASGYEALIEKANEKEKLFAKLIEEKQVAESERAMYGEANEKLNATIELLQKEYGEVKNLYAESQEHLSMIGGLSKVPTTIFTAKTILTNIKNYYEKSTINQSLDTLRKNEAGANA